MKRAGAVLLLLAAAAAALVAWSLPPRPRVLPADPSLPAMVRGALHVHTARSDGSGTPAEIAAAAARAGLQFVVLSDHDDASREPVEPYYDRGVLVIEAPEVSTDHGHVLALGLPRAPYPLAGEGRDVVEDVARLGGMSIAAHPGSPKAGLRWTEWTAPIDGLEWLNGDSEWRDEGRRTLVSALLTYPLRRESTLTRLLDRPDAVLTRWDVLTARRPVVALAAGDAHARIGLRSGEPDDRSLAVPIPSYESVFRTVSISLPGVAFSGNAAADARAAIGAIRNGRVYSSIDGLAAPARLSFTAVSRGIHFDAGSMVPADRFLELRVDSNAPPDARIVLMKNGREAATARGATLRHSVTGERAVYRVEIHLPAAPGEPPVPWVLSNPIYAGYLAQQPLPTRPAATDFAVRYQNGFAPDWTVETSQRSKAALDVVPATDGGTQLSMRWAIGGTRSESPFAALAMPAGPGLGGYDRVMFTARADRPMRLSVQLRVPVENAEGERWHRSIYLDEQGREVTIFFDEMTPRGPTRERRPPLAIVSDLLFVVDTVNTKPGAAGQIWLDDVKFAR